MGYAVLHMEKASGNDAGMSAHIERTIQPKNADKKRMHLNRELINFPEEVRNRTQAIQQRLDTANLKRKIGSNQVRAIRIMLSGTHEDMKRIEKAGKLNGWCKDNLDWLKQTFGEENLVSAVLHMDEKTPHIHATVVPIVTGERRKAKTSKEELKKKYKKKDSQSARLCADDVMARNKLKEYQNTYAACMQKYGLQRGIEGSEAKHISTAQHYRDLLIQTEDLKEDMEFLLERKSEVNQKIRDLYDWKDEVREKFLEMDEYTKQKQKELSMVESKLENAKQAYEPYKIQEELNLAHELFPMMKEQLRIADLCKSIGFTINGIKKMLSDKELTVTGNLYSNEHKQGFEVQNAKVKIEKEPDNPLKLCLTINGTNILDWFKQKFRELQDATRIWKRPEQEKRRGMRM